LIVHWAYSVYASDVEGGSSGIWGASTIGGSIPSGEGVAGLDQCAGVARYSDVGVVVVRLFASTGTLPPVFPLPL